MKMEFVELRVIQNYSEVRRHHIRETEMGWQERGSQGSTAFAVAASRCEGFAGGGDPDADGASHSVARCASPCSRVASGLQCDLMDTDVLKSTCFLVDRLPIRWCWSSVGLCVTHSGFLCKDAGMNAGSHSWSMGVCASITPHWSDAGGALRGGARIALVVYLCGCSA